MGVRGLTTYVNFNQDIFLKRFLLHDSNLVIDGHSLCAQLYRNLNCFSAFGGDYDKFASYVKNFFKSLKKCNVTCYVLFDGSYENRKLKTAYSRLRSKINGASRLDPVSQSTLQIFPLLLRDVFKEVLSDLEIPFTVCEFEADDEIAAMARHLNCPILSYDSDFFIYNVLYIPFNTLELKPKVKDDNDKKIHYMECKMFKTEYLVKSFGINAEMMPLLGTLLGNDYVQKKVFNKFFSHLKLPKSKKRRNEQQRSIQGLLNWLQSETLETALTKIIGRIKKEYKKHVFSQIKKSIDGYNSKECRSLQVFNLGHGGSKEVSDLTICNDDETGEDCPNTDEDSENSQSDTSDIQSETESENEVEIDDETSLGVPDWVADCIRKNIIPQTYINLYTLHLHLCSPQAEDYTQGDAFLCTLNIIRYAFDILTDFTEEYFIYVSRELNHSHKNIVVGKEYAIARPFDNKYSELPMEELKFYFSYFLKDKFSSLDFSLIYILPSNFQIVMFSILWWLANCDVPIHNAHSLLMSYIMLDVVDDKIGTFRGHHFFNNKYSKKIEECKKLQSPLVDINDDNLFLNKNRVSYEDCLVAGGVLLQHFELSNEISKKPKTYDVKRMHSFAQFQCCLQQFNCLNNLTSFPYESTKYSKFFNGTFVYNIASKIENQLDPVKYFEQYLKGANTVLMFYKSLCNILERCMNMLGLQFHQVCINKKKRRRKKKGSEIDEELSFLIKEFESEVII